MERGSGKEQRIPLLTLLDIVSGPGKPVKRFLLKSSVDKYLADIWCRQTRKNLFESETGELGVSELGYHFIGGIIHSANIVCK